jgi:enoyl-CoA hydratase/carnithine racemase
MKIMVHQEGAVATIELNEPPYNPLGMALIDALETAVRELDEDTAIRQKRPPNFKGK